MSHSDYYIDNSHLEQYNDEYNDEYIIYDDYSNSGYDYKHVYFDNKMMILFCMGTFFITSSMSILYHIYKIYNIKRKEHKFNNLNQILITNNLSESCSICLENFINKEKVIKLDCNHIFHTKCIHKWFKNKEQKICPLCRLIILI